MSRHCRLLGDLDRDRIAGIDRKLDGSPMAANTANRIRIVARARVRAAIDAGGVPVDVWPTGPGRGRVARSLAPNAVSMYARCRAKR